MSSKLEQLREAARIANEALAAEEALVKEPEKRIASWLHQSTCGSNHIDACSWDYEEDRESTWSEYVHHRYLVRARNVLRIANEAIGNGPEAADLLIQLFAAGLDREVVE